MDDTPHIAPRNYTEAREIGEYYRDNKSVIVDLNKLANEDAERLVDFMAGLVFTLADRWIRSLIRSSF